MSQKKRYHIHISLVRNENVNLENALEYALSTDYFLTWDLLATIPILLNTAANKSTNVII
ncbi:MAG: hypothetical protein U1E98_05450 [Moraxella osloensis]